ncbi:MULTISPECIES: hypothetical protein [Herbaspirillum]|uniref:hypothetical protein n=1 Tax=Herbaspirillum TaxID=963 RepID=UPI000C0ADD98|nr:MULTISPECIES: hypothetical protein [Herbaspirillum]MAF04736.1 hypothetical protein [Herbaspirillum sp.]UWE19332.1 hypothetical protein NY669_27020 [Herbaspirillum huttiense]|tara:strand:+ start:154 stop:462 length:309 start_codon:yes stop_codon:yes gene_type:complete
MTTSTSQSAAQSNFNFNDAMTEMQQILLRFPVATWRYPSPLDDFNKVLSKMKAYFLTTYNVQLNVVSTDVHLIAHNLHQAYLNHSMSVQPHQLTGPTTKFKI